MSFYTTLDFYMKPENMPNFKKYLNESWDAWSVKDKNFKRGEYNFYELTIHELDLEESLPIRIKLKKKFDLLFVVTHGVY